MPSFRSLYILTGLAALSAVSAAAVPKRRLLGPPIGIGGALNTVGGTVGSTAGSVSGLSDIGDLLYIVDTVDDNAESTADNIISLHKRQIIESLLDTVDDIVEPSANNIISLRKRKVIVGPGGGGIPDAVDSHGGTVESNVGSIGTIGERDLPWPNPTIRAAQEALDAVSQQLDAATASGSVMPSMYLWSIITAIGDIMSPLTGITGLPMPTADSLDLFEAVIAITAKVQNAAEPADAAAISKLFQTLIVPTTDTLLVQVIPHIDNLQPFLDAICPTITRDVSVVLSDRCGKPE